MKFRGLVLIILLASPEFGHAQDTLPPVVVQSTRLKDLEEPISKIPEKVIVLSAEDIKTSGAKTIQEVLQYQTGMVLYDQVGNDFQSTLDMRGFNGQPVTTTVMPNCSPHAPSLGPPWQLESLKSGYSKGFF